MSLLRRSGIPCDEKMRSSLGIVALAEVEVVKSMSANREIFIYDN